MPMDYDYEDGNAEPEFWVPVDGDYRFKIDEVTPENFKPSKANPEGSSGYKFKLLVAAGNPNGDSIAFDNIITKGKKRTTWKLKQLCRAIGVEYGPELEMWDLEGKFGVATFAAEKYGKYTNLKVDVYIEATEAAGAAKTDEGLPF